VLRLLALGHTNQEIAKQLYISVRTAETHRAHIMQKLRLRPAPSSCASRSSAGCSRRTMPERELRRADLAADPLEQFRSGLQRRVPRSRCLRQWRSRRPCRTGRPSLRMVLLKQFDERGLVFFSALNVAQGPRARGEPARRAPLPLVTARSPECVWRGTL
jgi:hypothetical protein